MRFLIHIFICALVCIGSNNSLQAAFCEEKTTTNKTCQENDYIALRALYLSTDGDNWTHNTGWFDATFFNNHPTLPAGTDMGTWYGVTLDGNGCVTCLNMRANSTCSEDYSNEGGNNLVGHLPPELGNMTNLTKLFLSKNDLSGTIPPELGNLTNLEKLSIRINELTGTIPAELGNLTQLTHLVLGDNELTGTLSGLVNLEKLTLLDLRLNNFNGNIPAELGSMDSLKYISLFDNQLTGSIPSELGNLDLIILWLSKNQLTGTIPLELGNATNLKELWLNRNQFTGSIPPELGNLDKVHHLLLSGNQLTGNIPAELGNMSDLKALSLSDNQLTGNIPSELANLTNLQSLRLHDNQLSGCYYDDLSILCNQLSTSASSVGSISNGNNFDASWGDFCTEQLGICNTTSNNTPTYNNDIRVFPIPAKDFVHFEIDNISTSATVILYDVNGKKISIQALPLDKKINVSQLNHGVYFYELLHEGKVYNGKITK